MELKVLTKSNKILTTVFDIITILVLVLEVASITVNVVLRYVFHSSLGWIDEFASFGLLWLTFASAIRLIEQNDHFHVDAVIIRFPKRLQKIINTFNLALVGIFFAIVAFYSTKLCLAVTASTALTLPISKTWIYSILPLSCYAALLILIGRIIKREG